MKSLILLTIVAGSLLSATMAFGQAGRSSTAAWIRDSSSVTLATSHTSGIVDNDSTAEANIVDTAACTTAETSNYADPGETEVWLHTGLLNCMKSLVASYGYTYRVTEIAGGDHSANSYHYRGTAFDVATINGSGVSSSNPYWSTFNQRCRNMGSIESLGPGDAGHSTHVHNAWSSGTSASSPGGCDGSGRIDVFCRGSNNGLYQMWSGNGGTTWGNWVALGGTLASDPSAVSWGPNVIHVFARGTTGSLVYKSWNGSSWADWISLGGSFVGGPDAASWSVGRLDVFVRSITNTLHHNSWNGSAWFGWQDHGMPPGGMASDPAAVSNNPNRIHVFCRGTDNAVWYTYWSGTAWAGWESIGGTITGSPDASTSGPGKLEVVGRAPDGTTWIKTWNGSAWSGWSSLGGTITGDPGAVSPSPGQVEVYGRGGNGALYRRALINGSWRAWESLGGEILGGPDAASWTGN